jgi:hypothetical protein
VMLNEGDEKGKDVRVQAVLEVRLTGG